MSSPLVLYLWGGLDRTSVLACTHPGAHTHTHSRMHNRACALTLTREDGDVRPSLFRPLYLNTITTSEP